VSVALIIQHKKRMSHTAILPAWLYHIFTQYLVNGTISGKK